MARATLTMVLIRAGDSTEGPLLSRGCEMSLARCRYFAFTLFVCVCYTGFRHSTGQPAAGRGPVPALGLLDRLLRGDFSRRIDVVLQDPGDL